MSLFFFSWIRKVFINSTNLVLSFNGKAIDFTEGIRETDEERKKVSV